MMLGLSVVPSYELVNDSLINDADTKQQSVTPTPTVDSVAKTRPQSLLPHDPQTLHSKNPMVREVTVVIPGLDSPRPTPSV